MTSKNRYRSGLEARIGGELEDQDVDFTFEEEKIKYIKPEREATYTPDFRLPNGIYIEAKGRFITEDRQKHLLIRKQHPDLDIRFVFSNSRQKIGKKSKTTYADWCEKKGFKFADTSIPVEWILEPPTLNT